MLIKYGVKLYFYGSNRLDRKEERGFGIIAFAVPDIGFVFRSAHKGDALECEFYALLTLCQFVEANAGLFKGQNLEFLGDSTAVVYRTSQPEGLFQLANKSSNSTAAPVAAANGATARLVERLGTFKKKLGFSLLWIPLSENRAAEQAAHHPTVKNSPLTEKLNTAFLEAFKFKKNADPGPSSF